MFKINQTVSYGPQGVFKIAEIAEKDFSGKAKKYYVLKSVKGSSSVIYVPVDNERLVGKIRPMLTTKEVYELINEMPEEKCVWIKNDNERKLVFREIIAKSDPQELAGLIRTVYLHQCELAAAGKKLHITDERYFKEAERILYDEFSLALDISSDSVPSFIIAQIGDGEQE